jgi:dephospho-CoA kinase
MNKLHCPYVKNHMSKKKEKNSKKHFQSSIVIDVPLIFEDSLSISLQDDILEAQRLAQRDPRKRAIASTAKGSTTHPL